MKSLLILLSLFYFTSCSEEAYCTLPNAVTSSEDCFNQETLDKEKHHCCSFKVEISNQGTKNICYSLPIEATDEIVESVAKQMINHYKKLFDIDEEIKYKGYDCGNKWIYLKFGFLLLFLLFL